MTFLTVVSVAAGVTLPVEVFGNSSRKATALGAL